MKLKKLLAMVLCVAMVLGTMTTVAFAEEATGAMVAKVGNTEYATIDEALANWTNGATLTLLADVTLPDVFVMKSTEHHILNLGTYTLTAASGKNAFEITCDGRSSASYALTINADANNPGGINATGKSCIYYKKSSSTKDRPIILINNGVFTGSYSLNITSNGNTNCPQIWINGGIFNSYMNLTKCMFKVSGGIFHASINCTGDQNAYRQFTGGTFKSWQFMTADAPNKFVVGSAKGPDASTLGTYDVGLYVNADGYLVVGGPVITEATGNMGARITEYSKWSSYLKYSSAATYGLFYEDPAMALGKITSGTINMYKDCYADKSVSSNLVIDCTSGAVYGGNITLSKSTATFKILLPEDGAYEGLVIQSDSEYYLIKNEVVEDGIKTITYTQTTDPVAAGYNVSLNHNGSQMAYEFGNALKDAVAGDTIELQTDVEFNIDTTNTPSTYALRRTGVIIDLAGYTLSAKNPELPVLINDKDYTITNGKIDGDIESQGGSLTMENVKLNGNLNVNNGDVLVQGGQFINNVTDYVADGYETVYAGSDVGYYVLPKAAGAIDVVLETTNDPSVYNIVLKSADAYAINEFVAAELTFENTSVTVGNNNSTMQYEVYGIQDATTAQRAAEVKDQFIFNTLESGNRLSGDSFVIGKIAFVGQGTANFKVVKGIVATTRQETHLGKYYTTEVGDETLKIGLAKIEDGAINEVKRDVAVNIAFNHNVVSNYWDNDMITVTIKDGFGNVKTQDVEITSAETGICTFSDVKLGRLTVTVEGKGFRKYVYETTLEEGDDVFVLNFWNDVKRVSAEVIETGKFSMFHNFLVGDIVMDYVVDEYDLAAVTSYYGTYNLDKAEAAKYIKYDLNRDGNIDIIDVQYVLHTLNN